MKIVTLLLVLLGFMLNGSALAATDKAFQANYTLGLNCAEDGNWKKAKTYFQTAVRINPERGSGWLQLARACEKTSDRESAVKAYQKCLTPQKSTPGRLLAYSLFLVRDGKRTEAKEALIKAVEKHNEWKAWGELFFLKDELQELRTLCGGNHELLTNLGEALKQAHDFVSAEKCFRDAIAISPDHKRARTRLAVTQFQLGKKLEAEKLALGVLKTDPKNTDMLIVMASIRDVQGRRPESIRFLERVLEVEPHNAFVLNNLGVIQTELGQYKKAEERLKKAIEAGSNNYIGYWSMAELKLKTGKKKEAVALARRALSLAKNDANDLFALGDFMESAGDMEGARMARAKGLKSDPEGAHAVMYVPYLIESQGPTHKEE